MTKKIGDAELLDNNMPHMLKETVTDDVQLLHSINFSTDKISQIFCLLQK